MKKLAIIGLLFLKVTYSQTDKYNLFDDPKLDSVLKIKKVIDKRIFKKTIIQFNYLVDNLELEIQYQS